MNIPDTSLLRLLQLASPTLPVGAYSYSHGMEYAVERAWIKDEASAAEWILGLLQQGLGYTDAPLLLRLYHAWAREDAAAVQHWSAVLRALRESAELVEEDRNTGSALARLLHSLGLAQAADWIDATNTGFAPVFALAAVHYKIPAQQTALGYLWSWTENQVAAAVKLVPLGQTAGQRLLGEAISYLPQVVANAEKLDDDAIGRATPALGMASSLHENQYTRLFRS